MDYRGTSAPKQGTSAFLACPDFRQPCWQWPAAYVYVLHRRSDVRAVHVCRYLDATLVECCPGNFREHHCQQCHHQPPTRFLPSPACKLHRPHCPCARRALRAATAQKARPLLYYARLRVCLLVVVPITKQAKQPKSCILFCLLFDSLLTSVPRALPQDGSRSPEKAGVNSAGWPRSARLSACCLEWADAAAPDGAWEYTWQPQPKPRQPGERWQHWCA